jgi:hypothetical protein
MTDLAKGYEMVKQFYEREGYRKGALEKSKRRSGWLITLLVLACTLCLIPLEALAFIKNDYLGDITVTAAGATRTKERFVESLAEKCLKKGDCRSWETFDAGALSQCISNSRLFRSVDVAVGKVCLIGAGSGRKASRNTPTHGFVLDTLMANSTAMMTPSKPTQIGGLKKHSTFLLVMIASQYP